MSAFEYTDIYYEKLLEARAAYNNLNAVDKASVDNYDILTGAEKCYNDLKSVSISSCTENYTGEEYGISGYSLADGYTIQFSSTGESGSFRDTLTYSAAGSYTIFYRISSLAFNGGSRTCSVDLIINKADMDGLVTANGYKGTYDGIMHTVTVDACSVQGAAITYSTDENDESSYGSTKPEFSSVGTHTVWFRVSALNYNDYKGSAQIVITSKSTSEPIYATIIKKEPDDTDKHDAARETENSGDITDKEG